MSTDLLPIQLSTITGIVDPTVNDDITKGYQVNNNFVNTVTGQLFTCTNNTEAAAVWKPNYLEQKNVFFVSKNGKGTNKGTYPADAFSDIDSAVVAMAALTGGDVPAPANRWMIHVLDGGTYEDDTVVVPDYATLFMPAATIKANIVVGNLSIMDVGQLYAAPLGAELNIDKLGTSSESSKIIVRGDAYVAGSGCLKNESTGGGPLFFEFGTLHGSSTPITDIAGLAPIFVKGDYIIWDTASPVFNASTARTIYADVSFIDRIASSSGQIVNLSGGASCHLKSNRIANNNGGTYAISGASTLNIIANKIEDTGDSTASVDSNATIFINDNNDRETEISNKVGTMLSRTNYLAEDGDKQSALLSQKYELVDLTTTPFPLETIKDDALYFITFRTPGSDTGSFMLMTAKDHGTVLLHEQGNSINLTVVETPQGTFSCTVVSDSTPLYVLTINTGSNAATIASGFNPILGTSFLQMTILENLIL